MALTKEMIEHELEAAKAALKAHQDGALVHEVVVEAFEEKLKSFK